MRNFPLILCALLFSMANSLFANDLKITGQVFGTKFDAELKEDLLLIGAAVVVYEGKTEVTRSKTSVAGIFKLDVPVNKQYTVVVSKDGFNSKTIGLDTRGIYVGSKDKLVLHHFDFVLLDAESNPKDVSKREPMGDLIYNARKGEFKFKPNKKFRTERSRHDESLRLIKGLQLMGREVKQEQPDRKKDKEALIDAPAQEVNKADGPPARRAASTGTRKPVDKSDVENQKQDLAKAKERLRVLKLQARTEEDSMLIHDLEGEILANETDLENAERIIELQESEIALQNKLKTIYGVSIVILLLLLGLIAWQYWDKLKINKLLAKRNTEITKSMNYASGIQKSFLKSEDQMRKLLPSLVLYFRPRDVVSGDFYWSAEVAGKVVLAAVDCTGHGVPGAFMSMIGNTLLDEIVNKKNTIDPGTILENLDREVVKLLQQDQPGKSAQDGMDMSICVIDKANMTLEFAGAKNFMIRVQGNDLDIIKADYNSIGGRAMRKADGFNKKFKTQSFQVEEGTAFYMFTDGFMDQFGGGENKKFNLPNFTDLILSCAQHKDGKVQQLMLESTFKNWMGELAQVDDVLVVGMRF